MEPTAISVQTGQNVSRHRFQSAFRDVSSDTHFRGAIDKELSRQLGSTSRRGLFFDPSSLQHMSFSQSPMRKGSGLNAVEPAAGRVSAQDVEPSIKKPVARSRMDSLPGGISHVLDTINPLHHLPVIGNVYRAISGDKITGVARMAGGALYGGAIGFAAATLNTVVEGRTGRDMAGHAMSMLGAEELAQAEAATNAGTAAPKAAKSEALKVAQAYQDHARYMHENQARYNS